MAEDYFLETKAKLEQQIPEYNSPEFSKMREAIKHQLLKKENDLKLSIRRMKTLILGDWHTLEQRQRLAEIKNTLLKNGFYAETIDGYYDVHKKGGLSQTEILEECCITHQLIVFVDGKGPGTLTEQNYLATEYLFHQKILFFINTSKFDEMKDDPSGYIKSFPAIIPYAEGTLKETVLTFVKLRIYRLIGIISLQSKKGRGLNSTNYQAWSKRLGQKQD